MFKLAEQAHHNADQRQKARLVLGFYHTIVLGCDFSQADQFLGQTYTQHSPTAADGISGLRAFAEKYKGLYPDAEIDFERLLVDNDQVVIHSLVRRHPGDRGLAAMDIFRVADNRIVEHWDVVQEIPDDMPHDNRMV